MAEYSGQKNIVGKSPRWEQVRYLKGTERNPVVLQHDDQLNEEQSAQRSSQRDGQGQTLKDLKHVPKDMNLSKCNTNIMRGNGSIMFKLTLNVCLILFYETAWLIGNFSLHFLRSQDCDLVGLLILNSFQSHPCTVDVRRSLHVDEDHAKACLHQCFKKASSKSKMCKSSGLSSSALIGSL